jgi:transcriptional regulator with XRE-family HTH domain
MNPSDRAANVQAVRDELQRMALDELRNAKRLTQAYLAEMLDTPQSSISRIEQRADLYLSTLRDYIHAMGGILQVQAVFPDGGAVTINRFGEYQDRSYIVWACLETANTFRLDARPVDGGPAFSTRALKSQALAKTLMALHIPKSQISAVRKQLEAGGPTEIGGRLAGRIFSESDLIAAGFESSAAGGE